MTTSPIHGLYAITDPVLRPPERLVAAVAAAVRGGARVVQYRDKSADHARRREEAVGLAALCRQAGACFIVNDDIELAAAVGADGVHVGRDDAELAAARARLGPEAIIGVSCYDDLGRARRLAAAGADYLAFGSVFPSATKPDAVRAPLSLFREARTFTDRPLVAIGGIDAGNIAEVAHAGADAAAVIQAVFGAEDVAAAAREIAERFRRARH